MFHRKRVEKPIDLRVCIYCLEKKEEGAFNREHVIPKAFGKFHGSNPVLDCVCEECNSYFSKELELKFARDAAEGLERFRSGMKPVSEFAGFGKGRTTTIRLAPGAIQGGVGYPAANVAGDELGMRFYPQVGIEQPPRPIEWFLLQELPERRRLADIGFDPTQPMKVHIREIDPNDAPELLKQKGYSPSAEGFEIIEPPSDEILETKTITVIGQPEKRVVTKIAMNYLAAMAGPALLRTPSFDEVRKFARYGLGETRVHVSENPWSTAQPSGEPLRGHYLAAQTMGNGLIVAQVSLMLQLRYVVHLMSATLATGTHRIASGHFFDLATLTVRPMRVPPLVPGKLLPIHE